MDALDYAKELIAFESPSLESNLPIIDYVERLLGKLGFATERIEYDDAAGVRKANIVGKLGDGVGGVAYFGHTDVVPADDWFSNDHSAFTPTEKDGKLFGRGSCDMKGSVACALAAVEQFSSADLKRPIYFTCTADEEIGYGGAREVAKRSEMYRQMVDGNCYAIIGEPTMLEVVYAHKGTCCITATSRGRAAHSSTREGRNANVDMIPFLAEMKQMHDETNSNAVWQNLEFDPPTLSWNIGINDHTRAANITAPQSVCTVYLRPVPRCDIQPLLRRVEAAAERNGLELEIRKTSDPLYVNPDSQFVLEMLELAEKLTPRTVCYCTDGGVLTELQNRVVFGPGDIAQAHTNNEWIALDQLRLGSVMFAKLMRHWCC